MDLTAGQALLLASGVVAGYGILMLANPARASFRDGLACLKRYQRIWLIPAGFAMAHAAFELYLHLRAGTAESGFSTATVSRGGLPPAGWMDVLTTCGLATAEGTATIFNCVVNAFPLSAAGALAFLCNWQGYQVILWQGLLRRVGMIGGFSAHTLIVVSALAALCKPFAFYLLPSTDVYFDREVMTRGGELINTFSFFFEYFVGVGVQIYLLSLAFVWVRGLSFNFLELRRFALRRFVMVSKWAALILIISGLGINLPLILASFHPQGVGQTTFGLITATRWFLTGVLLLFGAVQVILVLHNLSLHDAMLEALRLWQLHHWQVGWLIVVAALHFLLLTIVNAIVPQTFGLWTWSSNAWNLLGYPILWGVFAGWFLASWVCLFRRCEGKALEEIEPHRSRG